MYCNNLSRLDFIDPFGALVNAVLNTLVVYIGQHILLTSLQMLELCPTFVTLCTATISLDLVRLNSFIDTFVSAHFVIVKHVHRFLLFAIQSLQILIDN
jgi:hypothetical protein